MKKSRSHCLISVLTLAVGCSDSTLADCDGIAVEAEVDIFASDPLEFSWEGSAADEVVVSRTGDGVEIWNIYVSAEDDRLLNQISSPVVYGSSPPVSEQTELVTAQDAGELELNVEYQVQVFIQCEDDTTVDLVGTWISTD